jgi:CHAD domain-containing protein
MSGDEALRRIGLSCLDQIAGNKAAIVAGLPEGVHQMRVGVRRLRAVLSTFAGMLPKSRRRRAAAELRWLADALGPARNLDVFSEALLAPARAALGPSAGIAALAAAADRRHRTAYARAAQAVGSRRCCRMLARLRNWFDNCRWRASSESRRLRKPIGVLARRLLSRRWRAVRRRGKHFADQTAAQRHRLRIALKTLRYAGEVLAGLYPGEAPRRFSKLLKRLQDGLGAANDIRVGHAIVADLARRKHAAASEAGADILAWHEQRIAADRWKLHDNLDRLLAATPYWKR